MLDLPGRIAFVGLRCTGKTTLAKAFAKKASYQFLDTDEEIEKLAQKSIISIFKEEGESAFRELELQVLQKCKSLNKLALSCGGGIIVSKTCRKILKKDFRCIWLKAPPAVLAERMRNDPKTASLRPALSKAKTLEKEFEILFRERQAWYKEVSSQELDSLSPEKALEVLLSKN